LLAMQAPRSIRQAASSFIASKLLRGQEFQIADSTKGSRSSPLIFVARALFLLLRGGLFLLLVTVDPLPLFLSIPIRDQEQTYFFER
jgi:hypothetical protein